VTASSNCSKRSYPSRLPPKLSTNRKMQRAEIQLIGTRPEYLKWQLLLRRTQLHLRRPVRDARSDRVVHE